MLSLSKKVYILVAIPVLFEVGLVWKISDSISKAEIARARAAHARDLSSRFNQIMVLHLRRISFLMVRKLSPEQSPMRSKAESELIQQVIDQIADLRAVVGKNPRENAKWSEIATIMLRMDNVFSQAALAYDQDDEMGAALAWTSLQRDLDRVFKLANEISDQQSVVQKESQAEFVRYDSDVKNELLFALGGSIFIAFALAIYFNYGTNTRLQKLMVTATRLAMGREPGESLRGDDELGKLDQTYHRMNNALKRLRQRERAILDNAGEVICSIDEDLRITDINKAAERVWGYTPEELVGKRVLELFAEADKEAVQKKMSEAAESHGERRFEAGVKTAGGAGAETSWSATWSTSERSLSCVVSDISERKKLDRLKKDFVAMISHDLRTPLNSTMASLEMIASPHYSLSPDVRNHVGRAERNLQLALSLIQQLLEIERMESGVINLEYDAISTREIIEKAVNAVAAIADKKSVTLLVPQENYDLVGDRDRLVQVLVNLLGNALKFSPANSQVAIGVEAREDKLRLSVGDMGRGIPADKLASVFERFQQVNPTDAVEKAGSGLGLAICKAIVEAHKGTIGVRSEVDKGSTFWFILPREMPE